MKGERKEEEKEEGGIVGRVRRGRRRKNGDQEYTKQRRDHFVKNY